MIIKITKDEIKEVAEIHKKHLPSLMSFYSYAFIEKFYRYHLSKKEETVFFGFKKENRLKGFVFGTYNIKDLLGSFIEKNKLLFCVETIKAIIKHPKYILYIFESLFSKTDSSNDSNTQLVYIAVDKNSEKSGIGKALLLAFNENVRHKKLYYELEVEQNNPALDFYKKNGFFIVREINNSIEKKYLLGKEIDIEL